MRADDREAATRLIEQAVAAGWTSAEYLQENETLAPILEEPALKRVRGQLSDMPAIAQEPIGFLGDVGWTPSGQSTANANDGLRYLMSCMLAVVHPRGSSVDQATEVLKRAASADQTFPDAEFWFTKTNDVRTKTRFPAMADALLWLHHVGRKAQIIHEVMPTRRGDCVGLMLGTPVMNLVNKNWRFVPGAIAENLTSTSAHFDAAGQTKITELLHAGAAISSGPVEEPYSLPFKFPLPIMYGYYASGVSAIEAFYLSVASPYQLLIVGDPLAQPFARSPADWVGVSMQTRDDQQQTIRIARRPVPTGDQRSRLGTIEIFLEGRLVRRVPPVETIEMNLPKGLSGVIELRTVLVGDEPTRPRRSHSEFVEVGSKADIPVATWNAALQTCQLRCSGASSIDLMHYGEMVGSVSGEEGEVSIDRAALGEGPLRVTPLAHFGDRDVSGRPLILSVAR